MIVTASVTALPARVVPLPGESLVGLVRRTAAAMGSAGPHRLRPLLADVGKLPANVSGLPDMLEAGPDSVRAAGLVSARDARLP